jgi:hypothetical protein
MELLIPSHLWLDNRDADGKGLRRPFFDYAPGHRPPRYTALGHGDDYLDSGDNLAELLDAVRQLCEDVAEWREDGWLAAVIVRGKTWVFDRHQDKGHTTQGSVAPRPTRRRAEPLTIKPQ